MALYPERPLEESLARTGLRRFVGHGREQPAQDETAEAYESCEPALHAPQRWGLSAEAVAHLGDRLYQFWLRFRGGFTTRTRDTSAHAYDYLRAQLTMDTERNFANGGLWAMVDGELFLPEEWFGAAFAQRRTELGIPAERRFETKIQLGLKMVKRVKGHGLPFDLLACDALYGRDSQFRADVDAEGVRYAAQVPADTLVYLSEPRVGLPPKRGKRGRPRTRLQVLSSQRPQEVRALAQHPQTVWEQIEVRHTERGRLIADFAVRRVWTVAAGQRPRAEWLVIRRNSDGDCSYTLLNAPTDTPQAWLIAGSCRRYFTERTFEDAKTEIGWDEFQAQKYRAWEHHLALTAAALWFVAQTKLVWAQMYMRDPALAHQLEVEVLPALSTANVRELLKAVLPLPQLTLEEAMDLVITHLINRARSTSSRLKSQVKPPDSS